MPPSTTIQPANAMPAQTKIFGAGLKRGPRLARTYAAQQATLQRRAAAPPRVKVENHFHLSGAPMADVPTAIDAAIAATRGIEADGLDRAPKDLQAIAEVVSEKERGAAAAPTASRAAEDLDGQRVIKDLAKLGTAATAAPTAQRSVKATGLAPARKGNQGRAAKVALGEAAGAPDCPATRYALNIAAYKARAKAKAAARTRNVDTGRPSGRH